MVFSTMAIETFPRGNWLLILWLIPQNINGLETRQQFIICHRLKTIKKQQKYKVYEWENKLFACYLMLEESENSFYNLSTNFKRHFLIINLKIVHK